MVVLIQTGYWQIADWTLTVCQVPVGQQVCIKLSVNSQLTVSGQLLTVGRQVFLRELFFTFSQTSIKCWRVTWTELGVVVLHINWLAASDKLGTKSNSMATSGLLCFTVLSPFIPKITLLILQTVCLTFLHWPLQLTR